MDLAELLIFIAETQEPPDYFLDSGYTELILTCNLETKLWTLAWRGLLKGNGQSMSFEILENVTLEKLAEKLAQVKKIAEAPGDW